MTSVPLLNNLPSLPIMVWMKIPSTCSYLFWSWRIIYTHVILIHQATQKKRSIIAQTMRTSVLFAIRSKVVPKAGPQTKSIKKLSGYLLLRKLIPGIITGWKKRLRRLGCPQRFSGSTFRRSRPSSPYFMAWLGASQKSVQWVRRYIPLTIQYPQNTDWVWDQRSYSDISYDLFCRVRRANATKNPRIIKHARNIAWSGCFCEEAPAQPGLWAQTIPANASLSYTFHFCSTWAKWCSCCQLFAWRQLQEKGLLLLLWKKRPQRGAMLEEISWCYATQSGKPNTTGAQVSILNESGSGHRQAKDKNTACRQYLVLVLVRQEVQALVDTASDLNLIWKEIADHPRLRPLFPARAATQAGGIPLKTYSVFHEQLQVTHSFGTHLDTQDPLTSANIEVLLILGLPWLQYHNPILNFDPVPIQWRDSRSTVTDRIEEPLDLGSLIQIPADFQVMQVQLETLDESLEEPTILKAYRELANIFLPSNANFLPPHRDEYHAIELKPGKTTPFDPLYNLFEYQLKTLREYIDKNLANGFIRPSKSSAGALVLFTPKPDGTLRLCVNYSGLNSMTIKNR